MAVSDSSPAEPWLLPELDAEHLVAADRASHEGKQAGKTGAGFSQRSTTRKPASSSDAPGMTASDTAHAPLTRGRLDQLERLAREEGFASGRAEGYEKGYAEGEARARELGVEQTLAERQQLARLIDSISSEVTRQQEQVRRVVCDLIEQICVAVCQRELQLASNIEPLVAQALQALPVGEQHVTIYLHANDLATLQAIPGFLKPQWKTIADPGISEGGCRIESDHSLVDASLQHRLEEIIRNTLLEPSALTATGSAQAADTQATTDLPPADPEA